MTKLVKRAAVIILVLLCVTSGYLAYARWGHQERLPEGLLQANGRIEGDQVSVASKFAGRIQQLNVREGSSVRAGQIVAVLEDTQVRTKIAQANEALTALQSERQASQTNLDALRKDVPINIAAAESDVAHAQAVRAKAGAVLEQAKRDSDRFRELAARGSAPRQRSELMDLSLATTQNDVAAADTMITAAQQKLEHARLGWDQVRVVEQQLVALDARIAQAKATVAEPQSVVADLSIIAPISGIVTTRIRDIGEVVAAGAPLVDLVDLDRLYLTVYVPEADIGKLRRGLSAQIWTDAFPNQPFSAVVRYISSRAEFTPKEVQTPDERVKLVYAVHLYLDSNPDHKLTPGLPADAVIRWKENIPWAKPLR